MKRYEEREEREREREREKKEIRDKKPENTITYALFIFHVKM